MQVDFDVFYPCTNTKGTSKSGNVRIEADLASEDLNSSGERILEG
jgi:hypothetical protein